MNFEHLQRHLELNPLSRRSALKLGAAGAAAAALGSVLGDEPVDAAGAAEAGTPLHNTGASNPQYTDEMFDVRAVEEGLAWAPGPYGFGDQRGSFNEVTPEKTAEALRLLNTSRPVKTHNLGELMFNGFPAFASNPPRVYDQRLAGISTTGVPLPPDVIRLPEIAGPNRLTGFEERFPNGGTYQIGTQLDGLNHIGVGRTFYSGQNATNLATTSGTNRLGNENMGPIVTRGVVLDIVGMKVKSGSTGDLFTAPNGEKVLRDNYRITIEDIEAARYHQGTADIRPGDVVLFRTGWTHLVRSDPQRYLKSEPGIHLREARYLADRRPAIIGGDTWGLESVDPAVTRGNAFAVHQLLIVKHGIRIGEGMRTESLVGDGVFEFVFIVTPQYAQGATAGNTPPAALAPVPRPRGR